MGLKRDEVWSDGLPQDLPLARLQVISLRRLLDGDASEAEKLFMACKTSGFLYLDFEDAGHGMEELVKGIFKLDEDLFRLPQDELLRYDVDILNSLKLNGYKPMGWNFGGLNGKDGFETYAIPKNGIMGLGNTSFPHPSILAENMPTLRSFTTAITEAGQIIFTSLSHSLGISAGARLQDLHRPSAPSPDIVRLLKYHAQPLQERGAPHTPHTDLGSLTFLFTREPGLQILAPGTEQWAFVPPPPRPGCAVVNLGDGMALFTNGLFHSCLHRVGPLPGRPMPERYSVAYMMRAEDATPLAALKGSPLIPARSTHGIDGTKGLTSGEWIRRKFGNFRVETRDAEGDWTTTGNREVPAS